MTSSFWLELFGYAASVLVVISLMMSSIVRLRVLNLIGATAFAIYGALIGAWPVAIVNGTIACINIFYLWRFSRTRDFFRLLEVRRGSTYLADFVAFYAAEIRRFVPGFRHDPDAERLAVFVLRDMVPAGVLVGDQEGGTLRVALDFVIPGYRDFRIGRYLFAERADFFRERGIERVESDAGTPVHARYLERMGFRRVPGSDRYVRAVGAGETDG
jgi:GNAT superfamily N-acetyltransferase